MIKGGTVAQIVGDHLVGVLTELGVCRAVVSPGSRNSPLVFGVARRDTWDIEVILDERSAGFFALGWARATGEPVVLICTSGSAGAHYLPAVIEAYHSQVPLVLLTANRPEELHGLGALQTTKQANFFTDFTRGSIHIPAHREEGLAYHLYELEHSLVATLDSLWNGIAGPVHVDVAFREPLFIEDFSYGECSRSGLLGPQRSSHVLGQEEIERLSLSLVMKRKGAIVVGPLLDSMRDERDFPAAVDALADLMGWPIFIEATSLRESWRAFSSHIIFRPDLVFRALEGREDATPEVVIQIGQTPTSKALMRWMSHPKVLRFGLEPSGTPFDPLRTQTEMIEADVVSTLRALTSNLKFIDDHEPVGAWWLSAWRSLNPISDSLGAECDGKGLWEKDVMEVVAHEVDERATLHLANSMAIRSYDQFGGQGLLPQDVFASRGVSGIDGTIATSLGESKGSGLKPMVVLLGDLTFLHDLGSLQLACETSAPITLLVMDNDGGGIFRFLPVAEGGDIFQKFFIKPHGLELSELVSGFGLATYEVFDRGSLESTLNQIIEAPGVKIVIAKVDGEVSILKHRVFFERSASRLTDAWEESVG